ncbi:Uncharacterised protein [Mycobacteroides abscessus subsp. abscessus]|nr:Uncharacterised protein [Mycobacteroides abscessus subsp. abscessus]
MPGPRVRSRWGRTSWRTRLRRREVSALLGSRQGLSPSAARICSTSSRVVPSRGRSSRAAEGVSSVPSGSARGGSSGGVAIDAVSGSLFGAVIGSPSMPSPARGRAGGIPARERVPEPRARPSITVSA